MADVVYTVEVQYLSKGSLLDGFNKGAGGGGGVQNTVNSLTQSLSQTLSQTLSQRFSQSFVQNWRTTIYNRAAPEVANTGRHFGDLLSANIASSLILEGVGAALTGAMSLAKVGLVEMNAEVEQLSITMASMFAGAGQAESFSQGLAGTQELMSRMRKDARDLPGEFKDLAQIMMRVTTPAGNAGMSVPDTEKLAANAMAVGVGGGMRADVVGRELGEMIRGNMSKRMPLLSHMPGFSMGSKEFNALSNEKRIETLKKHFGMIEGTKEHEAVSSMRAAFQNSWIGLWSTLKDQAKLVLGGLTHSLFESIKSALMRFSEWFMANQSKIESWAERVGLFLAQGFNAAVAAAEKLIPYLERAGEMFAGRGKDSTLGRDIGVGAAGFGALQVARLAGPASEATGASLLGGGAAGLFGSSVGLLAPLAVIAAAVFGLIEGLNNELGPMFEVFQSIWGFTKEMFSDGLESLGGAFSKVWPLIKRLAEFMGVALAAALAVAATAFEVVAFVVETLTEAFMGFLGLLRDKFRDLLKGLGFNEKQLALLDPDKKPPRGYNDLPYKDKFNLDDLKAPAKPPEHHTTIHKVEIRVNSNQDPNRIAKRTVDIINDLGRHPKSYHNAGPRFSST